MYVQRNIWQHWTWAGLAVLPDSSFRSKTGVNFGKILDEKNCYFFLKNSYWRRKNNRNIGCEENRQFFGEDLSKSPFSR
jgi:hypothetical protein